MDSRLAEPRVEERPPGERPLVVIPIEDGAVRRSVAGAIAHAFRVAAPRRARGSLEAFGRQPDLAIVDADAGLPALHVPVLALTTRAEPSWRAELLERGAADVCLVPFDHRELVARVWGVVRASATERMQREWEAEVRRGLALRSRLVANLSHELRTPLNAIIGFSELLLQEHPHAAHIHTAGMHMLGLVEELLDLSRVETGHLELSLSVFDLKEAICWTADTLLPAAERKGLLVCLPEGPVGTVRADATRFRQVLHNLLSNAVKYTPEGGIVSIDVERNGGELRMHVSDTGIGIAPEDQARVFEPFERVGFGGVDGHGLGLAIARQLVEAHGGQILLESRPGAGSRFTVVLPEGAA